MPLAFPVAAGLFFFVAIIKFGNAVILDYLLQPPANASEFFYESWPAKWGFWLSIPLIAVGLWSTPWNRLKFRWICVLPALWLGWEMIAATRSISPMLTSQTLKHFTVCVALFYLGYFALQGSKPPVSVLTICTFWPIWTGIGLALCWVIRAGFEQHFGGLAATRAMLQSHEGATQLSAATLNNPDFAKRMASDRIFSTFMYPNTLAGGLVLLLPVTVVFMWKLIPKVRLPTRIVMIGIFAGAGLACLYWSGSKAGWLVALAVGLIALAHSALPFAWKRGLICGLLVLGVAGFAIKYAAFFHKDRNSVGARFAYWRVALMVVKSHPIVGTGPGTFQIPYRELKRPDDEATKICHNDYLEQGCDSGIPGFICYTLMMALILAAVYRYSIVGKPRDWMILAVWLGVVGLCLHSTVEFHLYIPALAWTQFFLLGCLASPSN
ncbi:MAG TPA: O-antigen ligase family protein [Verrucomicrobiae bacterium]|nr:O-antigen ligase family protein [Verrucomicrobiae bacterium]